MLCIKYNVMSKWYTSSYEGYLKMTSSRVVEIKYHFAIYDTIRGFYMGLYKDSNNKLYEYDYTELKSGTDLKTLDKYIAEHQKIRVYYGKDNKIKGYIIVD
jgi:hypothetical protein